MNRRPRSAKGRARETMTRLAAAYPDAECALHHDGAYQLLVATILSAFYPAITVLCASVILHERATPLQRAGIACALVAILLIASH